MYVIGKNHQPQPNVCRGQVVQVLHRMSGGATNGAQNITLMIKIDYKLNLIMLRTWASQTVSGFLDARVG